MDYLHDLGLKNKLHLIKINLYLSPNSAEVDDFQYQDYIYGSMIRGMTLKTSLKPTGPSLNPTSAMQRQATLLI